MRRCFAWTKVAVHMEGTLRAVTNQDDAVETCLSRDIDKNQHQISRVFFSKCTKSKAQQILQLKYDMNKILQSSLQTCRKANETRLLPITWIRFSTKESYAMLYIRTKETWDWLYYIFLVFCSKSLDSRVTYGMSVNLPSHLNLVLDYLRLHFLPCADHQS